ncbi:MAG: DUF4401 domain-containing protein [Thermoleophilia bacterium]|nr:DUF4401 domain-containing protein [Thermoleophilia bacterium]
MPEPIMTMGQVLERLRAENHLSPQQVERCAGYLEDCRLNRTPWYIKMLTAIGAIIAAAMFAIFIGMVAPLSKPELLGLIFIAGALILTFTLHNMFVHDLAIALSIGGQFAVLAGIEQHHLLGRTADNFWQLAIVAIILCAALYPFFTSPVHRFITCAAAIGLTTAWALEAEQFHLLHLLVLAEAVGASLMLANSRYYSWMKPLAYALAAALPATVMVLTAVSGEKFPGMNIDENMTALWPSNIILAAGILFLLWWMADEGWSLISEPAAIVLAAVVALGFLTTPGILAGIALLMFGYALGDRFITFLGVVFLPVFLGFYYYDLNVDLLTKSGILAASGLILLACRFLLARRPWAEGEPS